MRLLGCIFLLVTGSTAIASSIDGINVDSFKRIGEMRSPMLAEACGRVFFGGEPRSVQVEAIADPGERPGHYTIYTNRQGRFCLVLSTYQGRAEFLVYRSQDEPINASVVVEDTP